MAPLSEWLQIMLGEIARKREDLDRARDEEARRDKEKVVETTQPAKAAQVKRAS